MFWLFGHSTKTLGWNTSSWSIMAPGCNFGKLRLVIDFYPRQCRFATPSLLLVDSFETFATQICFSERVFISPKLRNLLLETHLPLFSPRKSKMSAAKSSSSSSLLANLDFLHTPSGETIFKVARVCFPGKNILCNRYTRSECGKTAKCACRIHSGNKNDFEVSY